MYARNSSSVTPSNTLAPVKCSSFGSTDAITLKKTSGRSWLTRSKTDMPCCSQCAWRSQRNFSLNLDRLPKGRPAGFPLCPGCHGDANCPLFLLTSSASRHFARLEHKCSMGAKDSRCKPRIQASMARRKAADELGERAGYERAGSCQSADGGRVHGVAPGDVSLCLALPEALQRASSR